MMISRRDVLVAFACSATYPMLSSSLTAATLQGTGFFSLKKSAARHYLVDPQGKPFFSLGLNHVDSAPLRYLENGNLWQEKYDNRMQRWLEESVRPDFLNWEFNCLGWSQEVVTRGLLNHRHSPAFTYEEYQWLDLPYCHQLPFADFHQWDMEVKHPDFFSQDFEDWCDYVARSQCARFKHDSKLIGYFYLDCPTWVHTKPGNEWKGPIFDPEQLKRPGGPEELTRIASRYYQVTHDAVRRYDPHHLILGDRYEANQPLPMEVVRAALPFVDVLSFQDFRDPAGYLRNIYQETGKPVLWADGSRQVKVADLNSPGGFYFRQDGVWWNETLIKLRENPGCVGAHLCGAYLRNRTRLKALRDEREQPDEEAIRQIQSANHSMLTWFRQTTW